jgi:hypothetical protein
MSFTLSIMCWSAVAKIYNTEHQLFYTIYEYNGIKRNINSTNLVL